MISTNLSTAYFLYRRRELNSANKETEKQNTWMLAKPLKEKMADSHIACMLFDDFPKKKKKSQKCRKCIKDKHKVRKVGKHLSWEDGGEDSFVRVTQKNTKVKEDNRQKKQKKVKLNPEENFPFLSPQIKYKEKLPGSLNEIKLAPKETQMGSPAFKRTKHAGHRKSKKHTSVSTETYCSQHHSKQSHIQKKVKEKSLHKKILDPWKFSSNGEYAPMKRGDVMFEHGETAQVTASVSCCKEVHSTNTVLHKVSFEDKEAVTFPKMEIKPEATPGTDENCDSQDLFITQKTFRVTQDSSSEASISAVPSSMIKEANSEVQPSQAVGLVQSIMEKATQTENFFSSEALSVSWAFQRKHQESKCLEQPIDLSLPRKTGLEMPSKVQGEKPACCPSTPKNAYVINSNKEKVILEKSKGNIIKSELKVVQTKLNESFFFKVKGDGDSPKAQSPLMRLSEPNVWK